jgi:hypothetical protein
MPVMCHLFRGSHHDFPESVIQGAGIISVVRTTDECIRTVLGPVLEYCTVLYCTVLYCTVLYCTVLYCTVLYCTVLYCTVLYCTEYKKSVLLLILQRSTRKKKRLEVL